LYESDGLRIVAYQNVLILGPSAELERRWR
jgi:hypothetical protein